MLVRLAATIDTIDPPPKTGRPRDWSTVTMLGALWHLARDGCAWRRLPVGPCLPPHQSVWSRFLRWRLGAVLDRAPAVLVARRRLAAGRKRRPTAAIIDTRSVRAGPQLGPRGGMIRFPGDVFGDGSRGVARPVGWASARGRRTRGGGGGALERGGAGGAVPRRGGRPLGPARPGDPAAGEGAGGGRGGPDDRVRGAVGREAAGPLRRRGPDAPGDPRRRDGTRPTIPKPALLDGRRLRPAGPPADGGPWTSRKVAAWMAGERGLA